MTDRAEELSAAPPDAGGHQGVHGRPDEDLQGADPGDGPQPATHRDAAKGSAGGSGVVLVAGFVLVLAVAFAWLYIHYA
ncbi:MAG TPA: hypothetical protein RMH99_18070 [Sandaracinaceae bacterium LLY-WYZ-13_1]|nr:hypothetical protein [Sandaracinaceae bacterium LLY-WYZ-13_1]